MSDSGQNGSSEKEHTRGRWRIIDASFEKTVVDLAELPSDHCPEVAFVGRSNAGKSSLLNVLCNRKQLARTSKTPGRTQAINLFAIRLRLDEDTQGRERCDAAVRFADLPGYGYAKVGGATRKQWQRLLGDYLVERPQLKAIVLVQDARRSLKEEEHWFLSTISVPVILALNKADKLNARETSKAKQAVISEFGLGAIDAIPTSCLRRNDAGLQKLVSRIVYYTGELECES